MAGYLRKLKSGLLRYPGGCETSKFHWEHPYVHWNEDLWDPNVNPNNYPPDSRYMDTDDYIQRCRAVGVEPMIGVNIQSGKKHDRVAHSINEAVRWVRYCKDRNYNVKYWYLDNEPYYAHNSAAMRAREYAGYIKQFVPAMRAVDPDIKVIIGWENKLSVERYWDDWEYIIEEAGAYFDIADVHWYWAWGYATWDLWLNENPMTVREWCGDCPDQKYYGPSYVEDIKGFYDKIKDVNGISYDIKLAALEWNIAPVKDGRFSQFQHALMQAEMLGQFIEGGLHMACMWPLTWGGDLYGDFRTVLDQQNHKPTPSFYVFKLYSNALGQKFVASATNQAHVRPVGVLSTDGSTLRVYLLHKSGEGRSLRLEVGINGFTAATAEAISLTAAELSSASAGLQKLPIQAADKGKWKCALPPHSLTMLTFHKGN
jgi:alpha-L-arabinofuranosidase